MKGGAKQQLAPVKPMEPKDELVDVIRGLRLEKMKSKESSGDRYVVCFIRSLVLAWFYSDMLTIILALTVNLPI